MVSQDERLKFLHSKTDNDFGLTLDQVVSHCDNTTGSFGRFKAWLGGNTAKIKQVLQAVESAGMSPAWFAAYEANEGYNSSWGWLNYTVPHGDAVSDAKFVANHMIDLSTTMGTHPSWIDAGNPVDFVPASVKTDGNNDFNSMPSGTIGRAYIPSTAAATWGAYYPKGLSISYNLVGNYGDPIADAISTIKMWGGKISSSSGGGGTPATPAKTAGGTKTKTPKPKPPIDTNTDSKITYLRNSLTTQLGGGEHMLRFNDMLFVPDPKAGKATNSNATLNANHKADVKQANSSKPKPKPPSGKIDTKWLDARQGQLIGSGQCFALAEAWAIHLGIGVSSLTSGNAHRWGTAPEPSVSAGMGAVNMGHDFDWKSWGWQVIDNPKLSDLEEGDIVCIHSDYVGGWTPPVGGVPYGHVVIMGRSSGGITTLWEQNGTSGQICAYQPKTSGRGMPTMETYVKCGLATAIRKV